MALQNAFERDQEAFQQKKPSAGEYLRHASKKCGRPPMKLAMEFGKLHRGRGRLSLPEYVQYGAYDPSLSQEDKGRFITNSLHWAITGQCSDMTWQATTEDKWLCAHILERSPVPVPETLAVIDRTERLFPETRKITDAAALRDFALAQQGRPFFGKENRGMVSFGVFLVLEADKDRLHLKGEGWIDYETFMNEFVGTTSYLLQPVQKNHAFFEAYTEHLATVRVCILVTKVGVKIPFTVLKLSSGGNIADSFWRPGNIACNLDPATGRILDARTKDSLGTESHETHPETGAPLVGETLPHWDGLLDLVHDCAPVFAPVRYQSMDIAVTEAGPLLIEINTGGGFDLPQLASGQGFLTDDVCEFFRECGYTKV